MKDNLDADSDISCLVMFYGGFDDAQTRKDISKKYGIFWNTRQARSNCVNFRPGCRIDLVIILTLEGRQAATLFVEFCEMNYLEAL